MGKEETQMGWKEVCFATERTGEINKPKASFLFWKKRNPLKILTGQAFLVTLANIFFEKEN